MTTKVNILIDGGFFNRKFLETHKRAATPTDVVTKASNAMKLLTAKTAGDTKDILFRIYYYDCKPYSGTAKNYDKNQEIDFYTLPCSLIAVIL